MKKHSTYLLVFILLSVSFLSGCLFTFAYNPRTGQCQLAAQYALSWNNLTDYLLDETERAHRAPSVSDVQAAEHAREQMVEASKACVGR